jgi:hypothetical protein
MATEKSYPKGLMGFHKHEKAPEFVLGTLIIDPNKFFEWMGENKDKLTDYKDTKQLKLQILTNEKGLSFVVDDWKPNATAKQTETKKPLF